MRLFKLGKGDKDIKKEVRLARFMGRIKIKEGFTSVMACLIKGIFVNHLVACFWHFTAD